MTDHEGNRKSIWLEGFRRVWKQLTIARGNSTNRCKILYSVWKNLLTNIKQTDTVLLPRPSFSDYFQLLNFYTRLPSPE